MLTTHLLTFVMIFMIIASLKALMTKNLLSAAIALGAVGIGVSLVFLLLRAPDATIPHIVVEILVLLLLIRGTIWAGVRVVSGQRDVFGASVAAVLILLLLVMVVPIFHEIPFGQETAWEAKTGQMELASGYYLRHGLERGSPNIVTAVLLDYRAYDTLGEATVLFTAIIGTLVLLRRQARKPLEE